MLVDHFPEQLWPHMIVFSFILCLSLTQQARSCKLQDNDTNISQHLLNTTIRSILLMMHKAALVKWS